MCSITYYTNINKGTFNSKAVKTWKLFCVRAVRSSMYISAGYNGLLVNWSNMSSILNRPTNVEGAALCSLNMKLLLMLFKVILSYVFLSVNNSKRTCFEVETKNNQHENKDLLPNVKRDMTRNTRPTQACIDLGKVVVWIIVSKWRANSEALHLKATWTRAVVWLKQNQNKYYGISKQKRVLLQTIFYCILH